MRESAVVRVPDFPGTRNRDKGKIFKLTEWPAATAEHWGIRAMLALGSTNDARLPLNLSGIGMEGIAIIGLNAFFSATRAMGDGEIKGVVLPLLDELLDCVEIIRDARHPDVASKIVPELDVEEIATRMWLRGEVLSLHLNFSVSAVFSALYSKIMTTPSPASSPPPTSPPESPSLSAAA